MHDFPEPESGNELPADVRRDDRQAHEMLQAYLQRLRAAYRAPDTAETEEVFREIQQHLRSLAAGHRELGAPPAEAMRAALRQFGSPEAIGRSLRRESARSARHGLFRPALWSTLRLAISCGIGVFSLGVLMAFTGGRPADATLTGAVLGGLVGIYASRNQAQVRRAAVAGGLLAFGALLAILLQSIWQHPAKILPLLQDWRLPACFAAATLVGAAAGTAIGLAQASLRSMETWASVPATDSNG